MSTAAEILATARAREERRDANYRPINYTLMNQRWRKQKSALTRLSNQVKKAKYNEYGHVQEIPKELRDKMIVLCAKTVKEWDEVGAWPDDWSSFQRALDDCFPVFHAPQLSDLR